MLVDRWIDMHTHFYPPESEPLRHSGDLPDDAGGRAGDDDGRQTRLRLGLRSALHHLSIDAGQHRGAARVFGLASEQIQAVGRNALRLLPKAAARIAAAEATAG